MDVFGWAGIAALGGLFTACWGYIRGGYHQLLSRVIITLDCHDSARDCVMAYCNKHLTPSVFGTRTFVGWAEFVRPIGRRELIACETVGQDTKLFWMGWRPFLISRTSGANANSDNTFTLARPVRLQTIRFGFDIDAFVQAAFDFVNEITSTDAHGPGDRTRFSIEYHSGSVGRPMTLSRGGGDAPSIHHGSNSPAFAQLERMAMRILRWSYNDLGAPRTTNAMSLLALTAEVQDFVQQVRGWLQAKEWFQSRGLPWKLGALFYGPPGNGKTSVVRALGIELDLPIHVFDLATMLNDELRTEWRRMLCDLPAIALIDDIDGVFDGREPRKDVKLSIDTVLNVLDGVERAEGLLVILTTNRPECLCDALSAVRVDGKMPSRPGRIDMSLEFKNPDCTGRRKIAERILRDWPDLIDQACDAGAATASTTGDSGAQFERRCIELAAPRLPELLKTNRRSRAGISDTLATQIRVLAGGSPFDQSGAMPSDKDLDQMGPTDMSLADKRATLRLGGAIMMREANDRQQRLREG